MNKSLKYIRISIAVVYFITALLLFCDFRGAIPSSWHVVLHTEFIPALLVGMWGVVLGLCLLTFIFGRLYCSIWCPLGILQDVIHRFTSFIRRRIFKQKTKRTHYQANRFFLRFGFALIPLGAYTLGSSLLLLLLDPYSNFGRIASSLFRPLVLWVNNTIAYFANKAGNYDFYNVEIEISSLPIFLFSFILLVFLFILVWRKQRLWCNTACPVGAILGIFSRYSIFKIRIDTTRCNHCKRCSAYCKSYCIDSEKQKIDASRCVTCFNCLDKCSSKALSYSPVWKKPTTSQVPQETRHISERINLNRKEFILTCVLSGMATSATAKRFQFRKNRLKQVAIHPLPPGATSLQHFTRKCTACQLCVTQCPTNVLKPIFLENGVERMFQPRMHFDVHRYCQFDCKLCSDICPNGAIKNMTLEQKKLTQVGVVHLNVKKCVVFAKNEACGACSEHCPTQAVYMKETNGLPLPHINPAICIGCGACESICPVRPDAIFIVGNEIQVNAQPFHVEEAQEEIKVDDFGF